MSIITKQKFKRYFNIKDQYEDDELIDELIADAQKQAETYINRSIEADDYTEYYTGDGSDTLLVRQFPVNSITSIYDDPDREYGASTLIDSADIDFQAGSDNANNGKIVYDGGIFTRSRVQNIKIAYNAGWESEAIPVDIKLAVVFLTGALYFSLKGGVLQIEGDNVEDRPKRLEKEAFKKLDKYVAMR
jgi:hypothetical protein